MFLAFKEIKYEKTRFFLIIGVLFLIAYLVFFLTGLANGLATSYTNSIDKWKADGIIYTKNSNDNISMSMIDEDDYKNINVSEKASLLLSPAILHKQDSDENFNSNIFGLNPNTFIAPKVVEGRLFEKDSMNEAIVDISFKKKGFSINDTIEFSGEYDKSLKIVGFAENETFQAAPVMFTSRNFLRDFKYSGRPKVSKDTINAIIIKTDTSIDNFSINTKNELVVKTIKDFAYKLPGYNAQVLTFALMIGFLIGISALIIGIFIYVLTVQKINMFGVMKAQGISNKFITRYVFDKTLIISIIGVTLGLGLTFITSLILPSTVPFLINWIWFGIITVLFVIISLIGGLFSVRMVTKIDPLDAMKQ